MLKKKKKISPILAFIILTFATIIISGFLHLLNVQSEYVTVNKASGDLVNNVVEVKNLFSTSGIKYIVTHAVDSFVNFAPLSILIIVLIGIGVLEKTGFLKTFFTILTKNSKKNTVTFILIFISLCFSLLGNIGFVVMLPIGALLFKYGRRNPFGGIISSFAALSFGTGINIFLSANDSSLLTLTMNATKLVDESYNIGVFFSLFIMIVLLLVTSFVFTYITEKKIMPKLPRYESEEEEVVITNKELRGLIIGLGAGILYALIIIYMIIPGLPLSGALLDSHADKYIDMLFGAKSLFNQGFIFIVTVFFAIIGFGYGLMAKTVRNSKDITESLAYSLDGIGNILVLLFFASLFISVFNESGIGEVLTASLAGVVGNIKFTGIWLILLVLVFVAIANIFCPDSLTKWSILSATVVPLFMNASISPEFSQLVYVAGDSVTNGLTPIFAYFVIYLAFLEKYNKGEMISMRDGTKYMATYSLYITIIFAVILVGWYMIGIPIGIGSHPGVIYGA
ncbi:MAG: AbgT family transporter [Bacilli bacterium]|nr:AbgT family transporter [Bacilli bacterium]